MRTDPMDERLIAEVERGRRCEAVVPMPPGGPLRAGDAVLFALSVSRPGQPPCFVRGGDSILVLLTGATDLGTFDRATGQPLVRIARSPSSGVA